MKLRNKKTGEIKECVVIPIDSNGYPNEYQVFEKGDSLAELNAEWEDAPEEPKKAWYLRSLGEPTEIVFGCDDFIQTLKVIGNYFESKEEAEKAVEKLKAWKRLKDKGFKFCGYTADTSYLFSCQLIHCRFNDFGEESKKDLDLLFGGEE